MALPFTPESIEILRSRYPEALQRLWDAEKVANGGERPGLLRAHVFDFPDGIRILISRETYPDVATPKIHFSASYAGKEPLTEEALRAYGVDHFQSISDEPGPFDFIGLSPGMRIPHWIVKESASA